VIWYSGQGGSKFVLRESRQNKDQSCCKVVLALLYKRTSKERRKENHPTPYNLTLYTLCLPDWNHSTSSDVPSKYPLMLLHTTNTTPYQQHHTTSSDITTPQTTSLSYHITPPPCPHLSTSLPFHNTNSFHTPNHIRRYHPTHDL